MDQIQIQFANKILKEEWKEFEDIQDRVIAMRTRRVSGTLRNEHGNRKYSVATTGAMEITSKLVHPDYERFLDMKSDRISVRRKPKKGAKRGLSALFPNNDKITRKRGRNIHNKIIFGRLNPISFRLMHELRSEVVKGARETLAP